MPVGFGTTLEPGTASDSSQHDAGVIHWQRCIPSRQPPFLTVQAFDPNAAEEISPAKPIISVTTTIHCIAR